MSMSLKRWYNDDWKNPDKKLQTSIIEGISVFLSLFDDNPRVKRTFCPPAELYRETQAPMSGRKPLPPIATLLEQGKIIALNFPASMNPGLARTIGVMLKMDFQRAVLPRNPLRVIRNSSPSASRLDERPDTWVMSGLCRDRQRCDVIG
jgi:hypothetical protein